MYNNCLIINYLSKYGPNNYYLSWYFSIRRKYVHYVHIFDITVEFRLAHEYENKKGSKLFRFNNNNEQREMAQNK